jgi:uncharacterized membrane protein
MWFILAALSALFQVLRNMVMKQIGHTLDDTINVWGRFTFLLPFAGAGILYTGIPVLKDGFWKEALYFSLTQVFATIFLSKALKKGDISFVTALMKVSMILLPIWGYIALGESPSKLGVTGVGLSAIGVYMLNIRCAKISFFAPLTALFTDPGQRWALLAAIAYVPCVVLIKLMALKSSPIFAVFIGYLFCALIVTPYTIYRSKKNFKAIVSQWKSFTSLGVYAALSTWCGTTGYTLTATSYVEAIKQLDVFFSILIGHFCFGESARIRLIWPGAATILIGVLLIHIGS